MSNYKITAPPPSGKSLHTALQMVIKIMTVKELTKNMKFTTFTFNTCIS